MPHHLHDMRGRATGYLPTMSEHQEDHTRIQDKERFTGKPEIEGVPEEEGIEGTDVEERLDEDPEEEPNRRDVPDE